MKKRMGNGRQIAMGIAVVSILAVVGYGVFTYDGAEFFKNKQIPSVKTGETIAKETDKEKTNQVQEENKQNTNVQSSEPVTDPAQKNEEMQVATVTQSGEGNETLGASGQMDSDATEETLKKEPVKVKGIYVTGPRAGSNKYMKELVDLVDETEINTMVIDIKNDSGEITYDMDLPLANEIDSTQNYIRNIEDLIQTLKEKNVYLIARVVAFKDPILANEKPELSIKNADGSVFRDKSGLAWVNPYNKEVWEYLMDISKKAADLGFDEIQYDYIRFSTDSRMKGADFGPEAKTKSKTEIITEFTKYAKDTMEPYQVAISADVYGIIIDSKVDADIVGQDYVEMAKNLDYISPMVYPSHYADGSYGIDYPDTKPYELIRKTMELSKKVLATIPADEERATVRPWLQDFTATWLAHHIIYNGKEIKDQIKGVYDAGYEEWILWNGSNHYTEGGLELVK